MTHPRIELVRAAPWADLPNIPNGWNGYDRVGPNGVARLSADFDDPGEPITVMSLTLAGVLRWRVALDAGVPWSVVRAAVHAAIEESK